MIDVPKLDPNIVNCSIIPGAIHLVSDVINLCLSLLSALVPARYVLSVLGSIAMAIIYGLKVNLSVAMVAMVNHTAVALQNVHKLDESHESGATAYAMSNFTTSEREECDAEPRSSNSTVNQVRNIHLLRSGNQRTCLRLVICE